MSLSTPRMQAFSGGLFTFIPAICPPAWLGGRWHGQKKQKPGTEAGVLTSVVCCVQLPGGPGLANVRFHAHLPAGALQGLTKQTAEHSWLFCCRYASFKALVSQGAEDDTQVSARGTSSSALYVQRFSHTALTLNTPA